MNNTVAFLGLGLMGTPMTANLVRQSFSVKAWNRTPDSPNVAIARQAGASIAPSIREAVSDAAIICTCVGDIPDVREVILGRNGVAAHAPAGAIVVDFSTIGSQAARQLARELQAYHLRFLDAPISGGDIGARQGTLTIMVGGSEADFSQCQPLFAALGKTIRHCGAVGSGQAVKLCNQVLAAIQMVALCEALEFAKIQEIDPNLMVEVCSTGAAASWALTNLAPKILQADYAPGFTIQHILKDLRLVRETLETAGAELPGLTLANRLFQLAGELDAGAGTKQGTQAMIRAYG
jgi:3-hydroxyisobutyrate dehydrogenase